MQEANTTHLQKEKLPPVVVELEPVHTVKVCLTIPLCAAPSFLKELPARESEEKRLANRIPGRELTFEQPLKNVGIGAPIPAEMSLVHVSVDWLTLVNGMRMKVVMTFRNPSSLRGEQSDIARATQDWLMCGFSSEAFNEVRVFLNPLQNGEEEVLFDFRGFAGRKNPRITFGLKK